MVLSSIYLNIPSANGICARNLVDALRDLGNEVEVVCYQKGTVSSETQSEHIHTIPQPASKESGSLFEKGMRAAKVLLGSTAPLINLATADAYYQRLLEINQKGKIDAIVAMFFPFEGVEAVYRFEAENSGIKAIVYELDSVGDGVSESKAHSFYNRAYERWLNMIYKAVTGIIVMRSHEDYWRQSFERRFSDKLHIADLPVLVDKTRKDKPGNGKANMLYSGLIEKRYRSPSYLLDVLRALEKKMPFEMSFYSKGDCENEIAEAAKNIEGVRQYGYVTPEELEDATLEADVLISIGNSFSNSVPSKLISYLGYGKPIIHFSAQKDDICNSYLNRYPLALIVDQSLPVDFSAERIRDFIKNSKGKSVSSSDLKAAFPTNFPKYSAEIINRIIEEENNSV